MTAKPFAAQDQRHHRNSGGAQALRDFRSQLLEMPYIPGPVLVIFEKNREQCRGIEKTSSVITEIAGITLAADLTHSILNLSGQQRLSGAVDPDQQSKITADPPRSRK